MKTTNHRLTWHGHCAVQVEATSSEEAIQIAIANPPVSLPPGSRLFYGRAYIPGQVTVPVYTSK